MNRDFPYVYRLQRSFRLAFLVMGAIFAIGGIVGACFAPSMSEFLSGQVVMAVIFVGFALFGVYIVLSTLRTRVVLNADSIELHGAFSKRNLWRPDIAARRLMPMQHGSPVIRFEPRSESLSRALVLPQFLETDAAFADWIAAIPDLDAAEQKASLDTYLQDAELDGSKDEMMARLASAARTAKVLTFATFAVCGWVWFHPSPYDLAIACAAIIPWIAVGLAARNGSLYRLNASRNEVGADVSAPVLVPGFALLVRALFDCHVFDWNKVWMLTIVVAAVCVLLMMLLVRELRGAALISSVLMLAYAYGAVVIANFRLDRGEPEVFTAEVLGARVSTGKSTSYYLELGPWGPRTDAEEVDVGKDYYTQASHREAVCVYLYKGALGVRWFEVWDCPRG